MKTIKSDDDIRPLAVFFATSGSKGDRLLFRYTHWTNENNESVTKKKRRSPYGIIIGDDPLNSPRFLPAHVESKHKIAGFCDKVLSNLFAVKMELCGQMFELKVNDIRFVGHSTWLSAPNKREPSSLCMFNIVFALKANASYDVVSCYHDFTHRLSIALQHEEKRCSYLSNQARIMIGVHDEVAAMAEADIESPSSIILTRSQLARDLRMAFEDLTNSGIVRLKVQKWIEVSFCLPHKVHSIQNNSFTIGPESIKSCLNALRPYHGFLLLVEASDLLDSLPQDASPALIRLIQVGSPLKSLQQLAADADLTLTQVFQLAGHLIYWAKATVIYPLCGNNIYVISPNASTSMVSSLVDKFADCFQGNSLIADLTKFSLPVSLSQLSSPMNFPQQQVQQIKMVVWMLQHRLLMQLHTYVYLVPTSLESLRNQQNSPAAKQDVFFAEKISEQSEFGSSLSSGEDVLSGYQKDHSKSSSSGGTTEMNQSSSDVGSPGGTISLFHLSRTEREAVLKVAASQNLEDLRLFSRLSRYFKGEHHLEEIMYCENVRRSQLWALLDKFRDVLFICQHEDAAVAAFYR